jgi:hypothetical protein
MRTGKVGEAGKGAQTAWWRRQWVDAAEVNVGFPVTTLIPVSGAIDTG